MNENSENSTKSSICDNDYVNGDVKVRDHCHVTGKYRDSVISRLISAKAKLNQRIPMVFHNFKNYDLHLFIQELGKFHFKINVIPNGLEKIYEL